MSYFVSVVCAECEENTPYENVPTEGQKTTLKGQYATPGGQEATPRGQHAEGITCRGDNMPGGNMPGGQEPRQGCGKSPPLTSH